MYENISENALWQKGATIHGPPWKGGSMNVTRFAMARPQDTPAYPNALKAHLGAVVLGFCCAKYLAEQWP